eukprot:SAG31_NODE_39_length_31377_cov_5.971482_22_plen_74_part_00
MSRSRELSRESTRLDTSLGGVLGLLLCPRSAGVIAKLRATVAVPQKLSRRAAAAAAPPRGPIILKYINAGAPR